MSRAFLVNMPCHARMPRWRSSGKSMPLSWPPICRQVSVSRARVTVLLSWWGAVVPGVKFLVRTPSKRVRPLHDAIHRKPWQSSAMSLMVLPDRPFRVSITLKYELLSGIGSDCTLQLSAGHDIETRIANVRERRPKNGIFISKKSCRYARRADRVCHRARAVVILTKFERWPQGQRTKF